MKRKWTRMLLAAVAMTSLSSCRAHAPAHVLSATMAPAARTFGDGAALIIPHPKYQTFSGLRFRLSRETRLVIAAHASPLERMAALSVQQELHERFRMPRLPIQSEGLKESGAPMIVFGEPARMPLAAQMLKKAGAMPSSHTEGYSLHVGPESVIVAGHDPAGTFYGAQTLCQMLDQDVGGVYVTGAQIDDYPSLGWRGAHLFLGNRALPFHKKLIARIFARLKMNNLVLECEQAKWDTLGRAAPPWAMSKSDLRTDIGFARSYGLTVTPLVNSVGHMPWLFADRANLPLAEDPQTPYAANVSNPQTDRFLFRLYDEVLDTFGSEALHIGGDEVTQRGRYPYRSLDRFPTVADAYVTQVTRLHDHLKARGVRTWLWSDMLLLPGDARDATNAPSPVQAQQMRRQLPKDIVQTDWHYGANDPFLSPRVLREAGFGPVIGATWTDPANIAGFSHVLAETGQRGLLQTTWAGYNSSEANLAHEKYQFSAFVLAAECAWNGGKIDPRHLPYDPAKVFDRLYGPFYLDAGSLAPRHSPHVLL